MVHEPLSRQPVTLEEVAREAGVSPSTVSRFLSGKARVKEAKATTVKAAIEKLGYKPNAFARSLVTGASGMVGVLTQDIASPFYNDALSSIERALMIRGYAPLTISGHWRSDEDGRAVDMLLGRRVEALIVLGGALGDAELTEVARQLPVAVLGRTLNLTRWGGISVALENRRAAHEVVSYLLDRGHRRIGFIMGPQDHVDALERLAGYQAALTERGVPIVPTLIVQGDFHEPSGLIGTQQLVKQHPDMTAIFCSNDQMAYGARLALHRLGLRVPEDMSLVGFDDLPASAYTTPPLTSVRQPMAEIGEWLAQFVLARLHGQQVTTYQPQLELRLRESVAARRVP